MSLGLDCLVLRDLYGSAEVRAAFDSRAMLQSWLDAESALAAAEARVGVIPAEAAAGIAAAGRAELYDLDALRDGVAASQHPLVPLVRALAEKSGTHGAYVHWGATTQDIMDTGLVLQLRAAAVPIERDLASATERAVDLARRYRDTPMAGRTHGQHAVPITFGLKAAGWAAELQRAGARLRGALECAMTAQLGGAAGTLAALGSDAAAVRREFCRVLGLHEPELPWHTARDRLRDVAHALAEIGAAAERIVTEVIRLQGTEIAELAEGRRDGNVGSSTMPQKSNPMASEYVAASARLLRASAAALFEAPAHAHERDMALWAVEWVALPQAAVLAGGIVEKLDAILDGLDVRPERMASNLDLTGGQILAEAVMIRLAEGVGHHRAHEIVSRLARVATDSGRQFSVVLLEDRDVRAHIASDDLRRLLDPTAYLGLAPAEAATVDGSRP